MSTPDFPLMGDTASLPRVWDVFLVSGRTQPVAASSVEHDDTVVILAGADSEVVATFVLRNVIGWMPRPVSAR